ncbi:hypothetical protein HOY82DRAFT_646915 [Tuber indicum]|nr:hypothetical protein HOY82DRAFT_646915 [Tuber indicum]
MSGTFGGPSPGNDYSFHQLIFTALIASQELAEAAGGDDTFSSSSPPDSSTVSEASPVRVIGNRLNSSAVSRDVSGTPSPTVAASVSASATATGSQSPRVGANNSRDEAIEDPAGSTRTSPPDPGPSEKTLASRAGELIPADRENARISPSPQASAAITREGCEVENSEKDNDRGEIVLDVLDDDLWDDPLIADILEQHMFEDNAMSMRPPSPQELISRTSDPTGLIPDTYCGLLESRVQPGEQYLSYSAHRPVPQFKTMSSNPWVVPQSEVTSPNSRVVPARGSSAVSGAGASAGPSAVATDEGYGSYLHQRRRLSQLYRRGDLDEDCIEESIAPPSTMGGMSFFYDAFPPDDLTAGLALGGSDFTSHNTLGAEPSTRETRNKGTVDPRMITKKPLNELTPASLIRPGITTGSYPPLPLPPRDQAGGPSDIDMSDDEDRFRPWRTGDTHAVSRANIGGIGGGWDECEDEDDDEPGFGVWKGPAKRRHPSTGDGRLQKDKELVPGSGSLSDLSSRETSEDNEGSSDPSYEEPARKRKRVSLRKPQSGRSGGGVPPKAASQDVRMQTGRPSLSGKSVPEWVSKAQELEREKQEAVKGGKPKEAVVNKSKKPPVSARKVSRTGVKASTPKAKVSGTPAKSKAANPKSAANQPDCGAPSTSRNQNQPELASSQMLTPAIPGKPAKTKGVTPKTVITAPSCANAPSTFRNPQPLRVQILRPSWDGPPKGSTVTASAEAGGGSSRSAKGHEIEKGSPANLQVIKTPTVNRPAAASSKVSTPAIPAMSAKAKAGGVTRKSATVEMDKNASSSCLERAATPAPETPIAPTPAVPGTIPGGPRGDVLIEEGVGPEQTTITHHRPAAGGRIRIGWLLPYAKGENICFPGCESLPGTIGCLLCFDKRFPGRRKEEGIDDPPEVSKRAPKKAPRPPSARKQAPRAKEPPEPPAGPPEPPVGPPEPPVGHPEQPAGPSKGYTARSRSGSKSTASDIQRPPSPAKKKTQKAARRSVPPSWKPPVTRGSGDVPPQPVVEAVAPVSEDRTTTPATGDIPGSAEGIDPPTAKSTQSSRSPKRSKASSGSKRKPPVRDARGKFVQKQGKATETSGATVATEQNPGRSVSESQDVLSEDDDSVLSDPPDVEDSFEF